MKSKKLLLFCFIILISFQAKSQVLIALLFGDKLNSDKVEFGLNAGLNSTNITNLNAKRANGFALGLYFNFTLSENWYLHPEVIVKSPMGATGIQPYPVGDKGIDSLFKNGTINRNLNYICIPLLIRYRIAGRLFAEAGPQVALRTKVSDVFEVESNTNQLTNEIDIDEHVTRLDLGAALGLEYKFKKDKGIGLGIRYYSGFIDVIKPTSGAQQNNQWFLHVSIPVLMGKKTK